MKLKICGVRNQEMLDFCQKNKVDFCGFNFVPSSKRKIDTDFFVPKNFKPKKVGIFMNQSFDEIVTILNQFDLDIIQFHGDEGAMLLQKVRKSFPGLEVWKAFSMKGDFDISKLQECCNNADMVLFDGSIPGSGKEIEQENQKKLQRAIRRCGEQNIPYGIAGGINSENILDFKQNFPKASFLDTASGVEKNGKFDRNTAQELIKIFNNMKNLRPHKLLILLGSVYLIYLTGMFFIQEKMIFFPLDEVLFEIDETQANAEHFSLAVREGINIDGYFFKQPEAKKTILFFHGNGGNITTNIGRAELLRTIGYNVVLFDYRGYGKSTGKITKEADVYKDGEAVYGYIMKTYSLEPEDVIFWGQSLGGAVAIEMAKNHKIDKLVVESSFVSIQNMILPLFRYSVPPFLIKYKFDNLLKIKDLNLPILVIHSTEDKTISFENSKRLFSRISKDKKIIKIKGGHNVGFYNSFDDKKEEIQKFLNK